MLTTEKINELIGVDDSWEAPEKLFKTLLNRDERIKLFNEFLKYETDVSFDWFHMYFQDEAADRKKMKQDFTPQSVSNLMSQLTNTKNDNYFESACGTGGIVIEHYYQKCLEQTPWDYKPSQHYHTLEELSNRAIPFLLFNLAIRGMNATVIQIDSLSREKCKGVFFVQNVKNDALSFSDINIMPYSEEVKKEFNIKSWSDERYPEHIENKLEEVFDEKSIELIKEIR